MNDQSTDWKYDIENNQCSENEISISIEIPNNDCNNNCGAERKYEKWRN